MSSIFSSCFYDLFIILVAQIFLVEAVYGCVFDVFVDGSKIDGIKSCKTTKACGLLYH